MAKKNVTKLKKTTTGKYGAKKTTVDNIKFDSKMESDYYIELKQQIKDKKIKKIEMQPKYDLIESFVTIDGVNIYKSNKDYLKKKKGHKVTRAITYSADFKIYNNDGTSFIVDVKGMETDVFKIKRKLFNCMYPEIELKLITKYKNEWHNYDELKILKRKNKKVKKDRS